MIDKYNEINIEADGYITKDTDCSWGKPLERVSDNTANPTTECCYPKCEECSRYFTFDGERYCTVPMVITKQIYRLTEDKFRQMDKRIDNLYSLIDSELRAMNNPRLICYKLNDELIENPYVKITEVEP